MHDRPRRLVAAGMTGLLLAAALAVPALAASPHPARAWKAEPRRVVEYRPNGRFTADTDLLSTSGYAAWMIDEILRTTTSLPLLGADFMQAERDTGINARYLVAHAFLETGWGTSWIAQQKRNLFGYNAFDRDPLRFAMRFPSFGAGIRFVTNEIRTSYLSPDGRWWRGFPTLRGVNRFYASDPLWADKIVVLANAIDEVVVTLRERGLHFGQPHVTKPAPGTAVAAGSTVVVEVPWTSRSIGLPAPIRFAARWTPVALAEGAATAPAEAPASAWKLAGTGTRAADHVSLSLPTPAQAGSWRLEIEARDSDGHALPVSDDPLIRSIAMRLVAPTETTITVSLEPTPPIAEAGRTTTLALAATRTSEVPGSAPPPEVGPPALGASPAVATSAFGAAPAAFATPPAAAPSSGGLVATLRNVGRTRIPAIAQDGTPTVVEAWSLPLAAGGAVIRLAGAPLVADLAPGAQIPVQLLTPVGGAVVVIRLTGNAAAIGRSTPVVALFGTSATGEPVLTPLVVPDLRDIGLARRPPRAPSPVADSPSPPAPGTASVSIIRADAAGDLAIGLLPVPAPRTLDLPSQAIVPPPSILVRTLSTPPATAIDPISDFMPWPADGTQGAAQTLAVPGMLFGVRLVVVALVPAGGSDADPATLRLAWVQVADPGSDVTPR